MSQSRQFFVVTVKNWFSKICIFSNVKIENLLLFFSLKIYKEKRGRQKKLTLLIKSRAQSALIMHI